MTDEQILEKLTGILRELFDDEQLTINEETSALDIDKWDSLSNIDLIVMVEEEFKIKISTKEIANFINVGSLVSIIRGKAA
ncbi:acyl carrier protein [candidate division KSB1 bacterium]